MFSHAAWMVLTKLKEKTKQQINLIYTLRKSAEIREISGICFVKPYFIGGQIKPQIRALRSLRGRRLRSFN